MNAERHRRGRMALRYGHRYARRATCSSRCLRAEESGTRSTTCSHVNQTEIPTSCPRGIQSLFCRFTLQSAVDLGHIMNGKHRRKPTPKEWDHPDEKAADPEAGRALFTWFAIRHAQSLRFVNGFQAQHYDCGNCHERPENSRCLCMR